MCEVIGSHKSTQNKEISTIGQSPAAQTFPFSSGRPGRAGCFHPDSLSSARCHGGRRGLRAEPPCSARRSESGPAPPSRDPSGECRCAGSGRCGAGGQSCGEGAGRTSGFFPESSQLVGVSPASPRSLVEKWESRSHKILKGELLLSLQEKAAR